MRLHDSNKLVYAGFSCRVSSLPLGRVALAVCAWLAGAAAAQAQAPLPPDAATVVGETMKIVVTATRRDQSVNTAPVAVTAFSAQAIDAATIRDTQDLTRLAPGLVITSAASEATASTIRLRGIGTSGANNLGLEGSVGVFVDGVYLSRPGIALSDLNDVAQIEVLRGPQGTLFGKNTSAGAIVMQSKEPSFKPDGQATISSGSRDAFRLSAAVGGPLVDDKVAFRLSGVFTQRDGYLNDVGSGAKVNDRDRASLRGQLRIEPADDVSIRLIADYARKNESCCGSTNIVNGTRAPIIAALNGYVATRFSDYTTANNRPFIANTKEWGVSGQADLRWSAATWKTILSHRDFTSFRGSDADQTNLDLVNTVGENTQERFSTAETSLHGETGRLDWLIGAYYFSQKTEQTSAVVYGADLARFFQRVFPAQAVLLGPLYPVGGGDTQRNFGQTANGWSVFTHNIVTLVPGLKTTLGARYLKESKDGNGRFKFNSPSCGRAGVPAGAQQLCPSPDFNSNYSDNAVVGTAGLSYEPRRDSVIYTSYSRGYKAGGVNLDRSAGLGGAAGATFLPELVDSYEVGAKGSFLDGAARLAITAFNANYRNFQQNAFTGVSFVISTAAEVKSKGVEIEATLHPTRWLTLSSSFVYNKAIYGDATADPLVRGRQIVNAPERTWQNQVEIEHSLGDGGLRGFLNANMRQLSAINTSVSLIPQAEQAGYNLVGARFGIRGPGGKWEVAAFGQNLTNKYYRTVVFAGTLQPGGYQAYVGEPRSGGLEAKMRF